jgi:hypothetical protein
LPEEEIRSIMGRAIPPEWTVNLLALGKEPWRFKDLEDQLNVLPEVAGRSIKANHCSNGWKESKQVKRQ